MKRTPLRRNTPKARGWVSGRRTRLRSRGASRQADRRSDGVVRAAVFARDGQVCRMAWHQDTECVGRLTPHHLRKASSGGAYSLENLVALCEFHNGWVEDHPQAATQLGLVVREGDPAWQSLGRRANR